jgi:hypothetical protein
MVGGEESGFSASMVSQAVEMNLGKEDKVILLNIREGLRANEAAITEVTTTTKNVEVAVSKMVGFVDGLTEKADRTLQASETNLANSVRMEQLMTTQFQVWNHLFETRLKEIMERSSGSLVVNPPMMMNSSLAEGEVSDPKKVISKVQRKTVAENDSDEDGVIMG